MKPLTSCRFGMLHHAYTAFQKNKYASLTAEISKAAVEGDAMCALIMYEGGYQVGRHISALSRNIDTVQNSQNNELKGVLVEGNWSL